MAVLLSTALILLVSLLCNLLGIDGAPTTPRDISGRLVLLRAQMQLHNISAFVITNSDEHQSISFLGVRDERRAWISGFVGSSGDAVVTLDYAAVWTDSRYWIQAEQELSDEWILMKSGDSGTPTIANWLLSVLSAEDKVGADPSLITFALWNSWTNTLGNQNISLVPVNENLVDLIWEDQPDFPTDPVYELPDSFAGLTRAEKLSAMREAMSAQGTDLYVVTSLDEIAWITNLRGADIPYTPLFRSYMLISNETAKLYLPSDKHTTDLALLLTAASISLLDYDDVWADLATDAERATAVLVPTAYSYSGGVSYKIYQTIPEDKIKTSPSPALLAKDRKSDVEAAGMRNAHLKDAVALVKFMAILEEEMEQDVFWDELKAVERLSALRLEQDYSRGDSFPYIAGYGPNSALPHYMPTNDTNLAIGKDGTFMLDTGGQYFDGTTDVTRTMHYGTPTEQQIRTYTALLAGCIDLASLVFPPGVTLQTSDTLIRAPLYKLGRDYGHGSTHGIGAFLGVHEAFNTTYDLNYFGSQEPGYYREDEWGMRLENIVTVVEANTTYEPEGVFLTFEPVTLVPYEKNLIDETKLTDDQLQWLNDYHARIRSEVGGELLRQSNNEATYSWLVKKTEPITRTAASLAVSTVGSFCLVILGVLSVF